MRHLRCLLNSRQKHLPSHQCTPTFGPCLQLTVLFLPDVGPLILAVDALFFTLWTTRCSLCPDLCPLPDVAACECVCLAPRAPNSHHLCNVRPWFRQGLVCLDELLAHPRADPRVLLRMLVHALLLSTHLRMLCVVCWTDRHHSPLPPGSARGGQCFQSLVAPAVSRAGQLDIRMVVDSAVPRVVHFVRRWERLVVGASAPNVCTANGALHLSSGFALLGFPRSCTRLLWFVVFPLRPLGCTPAEALLRLSTAVAAAYGRVPRGQWALLNADMLQMIDQSACLVEPVLFVSRARAGRTEHSKMPRGCRQAYCAAKLIRSPTPKPTSSPTLCSVWAKWEMILLRLGRAKIKWYSENNHFKDMNRIGGMPTEFEWKLFPGFTTLSILEEIQKPMTEIQCEPEQFKDNIIFMSMYNDIVWGEKENTERCEYNLQTLANYARKFPRGHWSFLGPGRGTYTDKPDGSWNQSAENMMANFSGSGHPIFRASSAFERGELRSKGGEKEVNTLHRL